jgi:hypothetical protein
MSPVQCSRPAPSGERCLALDALDDAFDRFGRSALVIPLRLILPLSIVLSVRLVVANQADQFAFGLT